MKTRFPHQNSEEEKMASDLRQRMPRQRNEGYLAWLRKQGCACGCHKPPPSDAAHLRASNLAYGKEFTGACKPHDFWAMPLHRSCHLRQHAFGDEVLWWSQHGILDPFGRAMRYYAAYQAEKPADAPSTSRPRKPKEAVKSHRRPRQGRKIANRPFPKGKRKFRT
jgi:hypothetical protein